MSSEQGLEKAVVRRWKVAGHRPGTLFGWSAIVTARSVEGAEDVARHMLMLEGRKAGEYELVEMSEVLPEPENSMVAEQAYRVHRRQDLDRAVGVARQAQELLAKAEVEVREVDSRLLWALEQAQVLIENAVKAVEETPEEIV
jgi:hypothetical protein